MGELLARSRVPLGFLIAAVVLYLAQPTWASLLFGLPVAFLGLLVRAAAAGVIRKDATLAREGPYRVTRNPLYLGSFLLTLGFALASGRWAAAFLLLVPFVLIYPMVIRKEEQHLKARFGSAFEEYRHDVPCFLPRRLDRGMFDAFSSARYRANHEYNAALGFLGASGILVLKSML